MAAYIINANNTVNRDEAKAAVATWVVSIHRDDANNKIFVALATAPSSPPRIASGAIKVLNCLQSN